MNQFLVTQKVKSIPKYLECYEKNKDEIAKIISKYGHKILKILVLDQEEKKIGVVVHGDIKTIAAGMSNPRIQELVVDGGILMDTVETDVYGADAIRLKLMSELERSISKVLNNESTEEEEIILTGGEDGKIKPEVCHR
tara:strand:+ start:203 stop:619 length:417 start_codon:yes stop_codon:yes gene_type:complete